MSEPFSFEQAFKRLEIVLEKLNSGKISLDESLKLYEEADSLIISCSTRLTQAEQKIEKLIKNREGTLALDAANAPQTESFSPLP